MNQACLDIIFSTHALGTKKALDHPPLDFGIFQHLCCLSVLLVTFGLSKFHNTSSHTPILLQQVPLPSFVSWLPCCYGTNPKNRIRHAKKCDYVNRIPPDRGHTSLTANQLGFQKAISTRRFSAQNHQTLPK